MDAILHSRLLDAVRQERQAHGAFGRKAVRPAGCQQKRSSGSAGVVLLGTAEGALFACPGTLMRMMDVECQQKYIRVVPHSEAALPLSYATV